MNCVKCNNPLQDKDNFCPECGQKVLRDTTAKSVPCPSTIQDEARTPEPCCEEIKEGKRFCNHCGWRINPACFLPGAKMCSGMLRNGAPCDNIVTPNIMFCSECGTTPGSGTQNTDSSNRNTNNSNPLPSTKQNLLESGMAQSDALPTLDKDPTKNTLPVRTEDEEKSCSVSRSSTAIQSMDKDMKNLSLKDANKDATVKHTGWSDNNLEKKMVTSQEKLDDPQQSENLSDKTENPFTEPGKTEELEKKDIIESGGRMEDCVTTDLNKSQQLKNDSQFESSEASQKNQLLDKNIQSPPSGGQIFPTPNQSGNITHTRSQSDNNAKDRDDEKSSDIWCPPTDKAKIDESAANAQNPKDGCKLNDSVQNKSHEQNNLQNEQQTEQGNDNMKDLEAKSQEESDSDTEGSSEGESDKESVSEVVGSHPNRRKKAKKKGREKYMKKKARKEKLKSSKEKDYVAEEASSLTQKTPKVNETTEKSNEIPRQKPSDVGKRDSSGSSEPAKPVSQSTTTTGSNSTVFPLQNESSCDPLSQGQAGYGEGTSVDLPAINVGGSCLQNNQSMSAAFSGRSYADAATTGNIMMTRSKTESVEINFCAIASPKFLVNLSNSRVCMRFSAAELGGMNSFWSTSWTHTVDGHYAITSKVTVPRSVLRDLGLTYSYCVLVNNDYNNPVEEYYYNYIRTDAGNKRELSHRDNLSDIWWQYDGVLNPLPEKGLWQKIKTATGFDGYEKKMETDLFLFVKGYFPRWKHFFTDGIDGSPADITKTLDMLYKGLKKSYYKNLKKWKVETDFKQTVGKAIFEVVRPKFTDLQNNKDIVGAIGLMCVLDDFEIALNQIGKNILFESFILDGNHKDKKCPEYDTLKENYRGMIPKVQEAMRKLIKSVKGGEDPTWLCCLPLFHFLCGKLRPFDEVTLNDTHNARRPVWWGKEEVYEEMEYLKGKTKWSKEPGVIMRKLEPMFEIDFYLPRSFMAVLQFDKLEVVKTKVLPPEVTLAGLYYFFNTYIEHFDGDSKRKTVYECLEVVTTQIREYWEKDAQEITHNILSSAYLCVRIGGDLVTVAYSKHRRLTGLMARTVEAYMVSLAAFEKLVTKDCEELKNFSKKDKDVHLTSMDDKRTWITVWLDSFNFLFTVKEDLKVWNRVLSIELPDGTAVKSALMNELKNNLQVTLDRKTLSTKEDLVEIYCSGTEEFCAVVQEILGAYAFQALDKGYICEDRIMSGPGATKYGNMLSRLFERSWEKNQLCETKPRAILKFTLSWKPFVHFLEMFYQREKSDVLTGDCQTHFTQAATLLKDLLNKLLTGTICVGDVELINESVETFLRANSVIWKCERNEELDQSLVRESLVLRCKEVRKFEEVKTNVGILVQMCQHFSVDLTNIDRKMEEFLQLDDRKLCEVCKPAFIEKVADKEAYDPVVIAFNFSPDMQAVLAELKRLSQGSLFLNMWAEQGRQTEKKKGSPLTVDEVMENVWQVVYPAWLKLSKRIATGDITFKEFQDHFRNVSIENLEQQLLHLAEGRKGWIKERLQQVQQNRELEQCVTGANVILRVVREYDLKGNFEPIKMIVEMVQGTDLDARMSEFNTSLIEACNVLKGIGEEEAKCLEEFINCKQLIEWLRTSMESLKELKVFVELASISAGEGDMEVAKVKFLHAATTGYAPLIFNLDDQCDYSKFLEKCQVVWKELKADPHLPTKLKDTNRQLEWLNSVKSAQGSVEVTSMRQAEAINSVGIYMVGKIDPNLHKEKPTLDDVLQLHVQRDEKGSRLQRKYQFKELQELQSKLMLVAGKAELGRYDVERFTIVFDAVVRLCNVYIKLVSSGCVLFTNWQARFLCDPDRKVCAFVKFGTGEGCTQLKGRKSEEEDVSTIIPNLAKSMEGCLEEWLKYIDQKRDEYHRLNFFTIDQMVILQKELVLMGGEVEPSDFIYPLLSVINHDCSKMDLIGALKKAKGDVLQKEAEQEVPTNEKEEEKNVDSDDESQTKATAIAKFIATITESGFSEKLARDALSKGMIEPDEIDEGLVWCVDHEEESKADSELEILSEEQVEVVVEEYEGWTKSEMSISIMTQNILSDLQKNNSAVDTLIPDLEQLWEEFLSSISSSVSDYLSVEHLGIILKRLAETETFTVNRPFLSCFKRGEPNLLLCQQDEILNTVLTIYSHDPDQPLPQSDEILMCTPHTTLDEVEIFWRRAVLDTTDRIHCLVNGDLLDYEVSDKGERRLEHHMQKAVELEIPYKLVVVCSTEREYHSRIVAALDKYRRPPLPLMTHDNMTKYIKDKLTFDIRRPSATPAAEADFEHCTVRVVKSWRAGVGKSLHKKRLAEKLQGLHSGVIRSKKAVVSIPLHEREICIDDIMGELLKNMLHPGKVEQRLFHIDLSHEVQEGVDYLLFQLLILGCLTNSTGHVWRKLPYDLYIVETMPLLARDFQEQILDIMTYYLTRRSSRAMFSRDHSSTCTDWT